MPNTKTDIDMDLKSAADRILSFMTIRQKWLREFRELSIENGKELKSSYKYLGTITAGIVGLSPQLYNNVLLKEYFFIGVVVEFLCLVFTLVHIFKATEDEKTKLIEIRNELISHIDSLIDRYRNFLISNGNSEKFSEIEKDTWRSIDTNYAKAKTDQSKTSRSAVLYILYSFIVGVTFLILSQITYLPFWVIMTMLVILFFLLQIIIKLSNLGNDYKNS